MHRKTTRPYAWDRGLDFEETSRRLVRLIEDLKCRVYRGDRSAVRPLAYLVVLYTQLRNGLRVSEAVDAILKWAETGLREVRVTTRKSRIERLVVVPREISDLRWLAEFLKQEVETRGFKQVVKSIINFCSRSLGFNTHALRYAFITYLSRIGVSPQEIAKLTGHRRLDYILHYFEKVKAEDILRRLNL